MRAPPSALFVRTRAQVAEYKYEIERLMRELAGLKQKWFEAKKRSQLDKEAALQQQPTAAAVQRAAAGSPGAGSKPGIAAGGGSSGQQQPPRFAGGGFSLTAAG